MRLWYDSQEHDVDYVEDKRVSSSTRRELLATDFRIILGTFNACC